jgi:hypothetical protein
VDDSGDHSKPDPPSWDQIAFNCFVVLEAPDDPEDTLAFQVTRQELGLVTFASQMLVRIIPEMGPITLAFLRKVTELSDAQGFLDVTPELRREVGLPDPDDDPA